MYDNIETITTSSLCAAYVGVISKSRGADTVLQATALIAGELDEFSIVLVGEVQDREWLDRTIEKYGIEEHIKITGYVSHQAALGHIKSADAGLCLFPRSAETEYIYPIKVFEYMALGTIPICTDLTGMSEAVTDGEDGYLVESGDARDVAEALLSTDEEQTAAMADKAAETLEAYDWSVLNERFRHAITSPS